ncbi:hypothetical protein ACFYNO_07765 [Kitasatospora sp. NPDC006697]|uniref:hypothetical protein n=1 Tax=Kitasatospora sp. NPDC006697 TaxID=3364020 RepID=UPI0036CAD146
MDFIAPRLLLLTRLGWFHLDRPVFVPAGARCRTEADALVVELPDGRRLSYPGSVCR